MEGPVEIRTATTGRDLEAVVEILADAFDGYPLTDWLVLRDRRVDRRLERYVRAMVELAVERGHACVDSDRRGAALWLAPGRSEPGRFELVRHLFQVVQIAGFCRTPSRMLGLAELASDHPSEPHAYLSMLGVRTARQRCGIGGALLEAGLARWDEAGVGAYLHVSNPKAIPFYQRFGFDVLGEPCVLREGPQVWRLWRSCASR